MYNYNPPITALRPKFGRRLDADIGDWGECVQAPIARGFAPNVCSALAPPGACSQKRLSHAPVPTSMLHGDHQNEAAPEKYGGQIPEEKIVLLLFRHCFT